MKIDINDLDLYNTEETDKPKGKPKSKRKPKNTIKKFKKYAE